MKVSAQPMATEMVYNDLNENIVTISNTSPDSRPDGTPNVLGDLWWSAHTGVMYIWNSDDVNQFFDPVNNNVEPPYTAEWVCTDPSGLVPFDQYSSDSLWPVPTSARAANVFSSSIRVIIAETAPSSFAVDGVGCEPIEPGNLWWSPRTGKLYIWFEDGDSKQWVVTNPHGTVSSEYAFDGMIGGAGGGVGDGDDTIVYAPIARLPELATQERLFFENVENFFPNDEIQFQLGAPGVDANKKMLRLDR